MNKNKEEANRQLRHRAYALLATLAVTLLIASIAGVGWGAAWINEKKAKYQSKIATFRQLAALPTLERNRHLDRSLLLAVKALRTGNTFEVRNSLFKALQVQSRPGTFLHPMRAPS